MCKKLEPLAGLGRLFREKDWKKIRSMLKTYPSLYVLTHSLTTTLTYILRSNKRYTEDHEEDGTSIHLALRHDAPSDIIMSLLDNHPRCTFKIDGDGLTPLALAVKVSNTISFSIFLSILKSNPVATKVSDKSGKFPLHHACIVCLHFFLCQLCHSNHNSLVSPINLSLHRIPYSQ